MADATGALNIQLLKTIAILWLDFACAAALMIHSLVSLICRAAAAVYMACACCVQGDGSKVTVEVGLLGGEVNKLLAAHARYDLLLWPLVQELCRTVACASIACLKHVAYASVARVVVWSRF